MLAEALRGSAAWGSTAFRAMTWRKVELVHDLLLQVRPAGWTLCNTNPI